MDWGIKVSLPGYDVKTATPEQCSIHSSYDSFKLPVTTDVPQAGNIKVTFIDNPAVGTYQIAQIKHGYGYIPACYFFFDLRGSSGNLGSSTDLAYEFDINAGADQYFKVVVDTQNVTFNLVVGAQILNLTGKYYSFRYSIFANDGE